MPVHPRLKKTQPKITTQLSTFLPPDFDQTRPIGLIAGRGVYPLLLAENAKKAGATVRLIAFEGETLDELWDSFAPDQRIRVKVGQLGKMLKSLKKLDCSYAVMAGQISPRKLFKGLHPDLKAVGMLVSLKRKNADTIFGYIANEIEKLGIHQIDARIFLDDHIATSGWMTKRSEKLEEADIEHGKEIAAEMARLDVGQGVVVRKGTVIAVEAFEGTDPMLKRAGDFKTDHLIFAKTIKRDQDFRFDVPVFGLRTVEVMQTAGVKTAVLKAGSTLMLEKEKVLEAAVKAKIQILGY